MIDKYRMAEIDKTILGLYDFMSNVRFSSSVQMAIILLKEYREIVEKETWKDVKCLVVKKVNDGQVD